MALDSKISMISSILIYYFFLSNNVYTDTYTKLNLNGNQNIELHFVFSIFIIFISIYKYLFNFYTDDFDSIKDIRRPFRGRP